MPLTFETMDDAGYFRVNWRDRISETEMVEAYRTFLDSHDSMEHFRELCDLSEADLSEIQLGGLRELSTVVQEFCERNQIKDARCACFIPTELNEVIMKLYKQASKESAETTMIFTKIDDAMAWLQS